MTYQEIAILIDSNLADFSGITPDKHREVELALLDYIADKEKFLPKHRGWFIIPDVHSGTIGTLYTTSGNISEAKLETRNSNGSQIKVTLPTALATTNYKVVLQGEALNTLYNDTSVGSIMFKKISQTQFYVGLTEFQGDVQNIKIHFETILLD